MQLDCVVIGAGVLGLAVARTLQRQGRDVVLIEAEGQFGQGTSSRNSEVIHAGIYYPVGSLKAQACVRGRALLYRYCEERGVPHQRLGKLIVAVDDAEVAVLHKYLESAAANGVTDLRWVEADELRSREPAVKGVRALLSPSTGIIDSHAYMQALLHDFEAEGGTFIRKTRVVGGSVMSDGIVLQLDDGSEYEAQARSVVNSAGLHAPDVAAGLAGLVPESVPTAHYAIGHYYVYPGRSPFRQLVYPIAVKGGLGVHVTLDMSGGTRFGPDVRWRDSIDYTFDDSGKSRFIEAIRRYFPDVNEDNLLPGYTGIRPKIVGPGQGDADFVIQDARQHGCQGLINLFGIESPGLTSSLALADDVAARLQAQT